MAEPIERWLGWREQVRPISPVTAANYRGAIDRYILPNLGRAKVQLVDLGSAPTKWYTSWTVSTAGHCRHRRSARSQRPSGAFKQALVWGGGSSCLHVRDDDVGQRCLCHFARGTRGPGRARDRGGHPARHVGTWITWARSEQHDPLDVKALDHRVHTAWRLRQGSHYVELDRALPGLLTDAHLASQELTGDQQGLAFVFLAHSYNTASSLLRKLGDDGLAMIAADRAVQMARMVNEPLEHGAALGVAESSAAEDADPCWRLHPQMEEPAVGSAGGYDTSK